MIFTELNQGNQERAIAEIRDNDGYLDYEWYKPLSEDFEAILFILGFYSVKTYFSGFSSQGDGACFTAKYEYGKGSVKAIKKFTPLDDELHSIAQRLQDIQAKVIYDLGITIEHTSRYYHEKSVTVYLWSRRDLVSDDKLYEYDEEVTELIEELSSGYYKRLNEQYDYLMSDEAVKEHIIYNELEFDYEEDDDENN